MFEIVDIGTAANDGTGDTLRKAFAKCNKTLLYSSGTHGWGDADYAAVMSDWLVNTGTLVNQITSAGTTIVVSPSSGTGNVSLSFYGVNSITSTGTTIVVSPSSGTGAVTLGYYGVSKVTSTDSSVTISPYSGTGTVNLSLPVSTLNQVQIEVFL